MAYWSEHNEGHFPALKESALLAENIRAFFGSLR